MIDPIESSLIMYDLKFPQLIPNMTTRHLEKLLSLIQNELRERDINENR